MTFSAGLSHPVSTLEFTHAKTQSAASGSRTLLARPHGVLAQCPSPAADGVGNQLAPGSGQRPFPPLPGPPAPGHALGLQAHHRWRGGLDYAPQGNPADVWKLVALELALAIVSDVLGRAN